MTDSFTGTGGDWNTGTNWSAGTPTSASVALIQNSGTSSLIVDVGAADAGSTAAKAFGLFLNATTAANVVVNVQGGTGGTLAIGGGGITFGNVAGKSGEAVLLLNGPGLLSDAGNVVGLNEAEIQVGGGSTFAVAGNTNIAGTGDIFNDAGTYTTGNLALIGASSASPIAVSISGVLGTDQNSLLFGGSIGTASQITNATVNAGLGSSGTIDLGSSLGTGTSQLTLINDAVTVNGTLTINGANVRDTGLIGPGVVDQSATTIEAGGTLNVHTQYYVNNAPGQTFINAGVVNVTGPNGDFIVGSLAHASSSAGGVFNVTAGATIDAKSVTGLNGLQVTLSGGTLQADTFVGGTTIDAGSGGITVSSPSSLVLASFADLTVPGLLGNAGSAVFTGSSVVYTDPLGNKETFANVTDTSLTAGASLKVSFVASNHNDIVITLPH